MSRNNIRGMNLFSFVARIMMEPGVDFLSVENQFYVHPLVREASPLLKAE